MAHFRAVLQGNRGAVSRLATKASGLEILAQSWEGDLMLTLHHDETTGRDFYTLRAGPHGTRPARVLQSSPISWET